MSQFASWAAEGSKNSNSTFNHFLTHYFQIQIVRGHDEGLFRGNRHYDENKTLFFYLIHSRDDGATAETRLVVVIIIIIIISLSISYRSK